MAKPKEADIKVRVSTEMKQRIIAAAEARGESESLIVREALVQYLSRDETPSPAPIVHPTPAHPVKYPKGHDIDQAGKGPTQGKRKRKYSTPRP